MDYPGDDPMNQNNPLPPSARAFNYGVPGVPYAILNGGAGPEYRYDFSDESEQPDEEVLLAASLEISPFDLLLDVDFRSSRLVGSAKASCATTSYSSNIQLYVVVIEEEVTAYVGAGNTSLYRNVVLDMVPTSAGKLLGNDWSAGDAESLNFSWDYASYVEDLDDLAVIAFLFDRDVEKVLQASIVRASPGTGVDDRKNESGQLSLFPNPAQETIFLSLGLPAEKEGQIMVMDLAGRKVLEVDMAPGLSIRQLDVSGLAEGVYLVHWMESGLSRGKGKFVISR
jgi:hypothetical protein